MKIEKVDFNNKSFNFLINLYFSRSIPYGESLSSLSSRSAESQNLIRNLKSCQLSLASVLNDGEYAFFMFFKEEKKGLNLFFAFPNLSKQITNKIKVISIYKMLFEAFDFFKVDEIYGDIERVHKKNNYKNWLKRYLSVKYVENEGKEFDQVFFNKDKVKKHYEKLSISSSRD